jgi:hypothetical protein
MNDTRPRTSEDQRRDVEKKRANVDCWIPLFGWMVGARIISFAFIVSDRWRMRPILQPEEMQDAKCERGYGVL